MKSQEGQDLRSKIQLYSAGAGSGKTHTITEKIVEAIRSGQAEPQKVMAMTFTEKSAHELRERIASGIKRASITEPKLSNAVREIELARIGTIHSVCFALVKRFCFEAGVSPDPSVMSAETSAFLISDALTERLNSFDPKFFEVSTRLSLELEDWKNDVQAIVGAAQTNNFDNEQLEQFAQSSLQSFKECVGDVPFTRDWESFVCEKIRDVLATLEAKDELAKNESEFRDLAMNFLNFKPDLRTWALWQDISAFAGAFLKEFRAELIEFPRHPLFAHDFEVYLRGIFTLAIQVRTDFAALKLASGMVDYNDMESYCFKLLSIDSVQEALADELELLVVDEFQDSSPLQLAIFLKLAQCAKAVVFVGDIKQSIYGFRGTDSQLIKGFEDAIRKVNPDAIFKLPDSHRSDRNLVEFANESFAKAFEGQNFTLNPLPSEPDGKKPYRPLGQENRLSVWELSGKNNGLRFEEIAKHIKNLVESGELKAYDKSQRSYRTVEFRDVALLVRSNSHAEDICAALRKAEVPVLVSPSDFCLSYEANLVLASLRIVIDSTDSIAKAEILGLYDGIAQGAWLEERIKHIKEKRPSETWQNHHPLIAQLIEQTSSITSANMLETLDILLHECGLLDRIMAWQGDELDRAQRLRIIELMRSYASSFDQEAGNRGRLGLHQEFLKRIGDAERSSKVPFGKRGNSEEKIQIKGEMPGSSNAVKVMTYHASKGLEFPLVIMMDLDTPFAFDEFGLHVDCQDGEFNWENPLAAQSLRFWPWPFAGKKNSNLDAIFEASPAYKALHERGQARVAQEAKNLLYVGVTRARDYLVLVLPKQKAEPKGAAKAAPGAKKPLSTGEWAKVAEVPWTYGSGQSEVGIGEKVFACMNAGGIRVSEEVEVKKADLYWFVPGTGNGGLAPRKKFTATSLPARADGKAEGAVELGEVISVPGHEVWGSVGEALHQIISVGCRRELDAGEVQGIIAGRGLEGVVRVEDAIEVVSRLKGYSEKTWPGATLHPEFPVVFRNERSQSAVGWIDLLVETAEGFVIVDHKSFVGGDLGAKAVEYSGQLGFYREAVELATGKRVLGCLVHFMLGARFVEVL